MAIAFGNAGTGLVYGSRTNSAVPVPSGVAANDIVLIHLYQDDSTVTLTPPSGFTEVTFSPTPATTSPTQSQHVYWKRATGADSGSYTFTHATSNTQAEATRWTGCITTGTPLEVLGSAQRASSGATTPAVSGTTTNANEMLVFTGSIYTSPTWTPPTGFTEAIDFESLTVDYKAQASAGATGSITATASASNAQTATLIALLPAGGSTPVALADTGSGADALTVHAAVPLSDTGSGVDSLAVHAAIAVSDTGSGADTLTAGVSIGLADTGSGADALTVHVAVPLTDTATATDTLHAAVPPPHVPGTAALASDGQGVATLAVVSTSADLASADTDAVLSAQTGSATVTTAQTVATLAAAEATATLTPAEATAVIATT